jgi:hypothetical protein
MVSARFAHASDIHIGGFPNKTLRSREEEAVSTFVRKCIEEKVDFVVLSGDTFDSNIPPIREAIMFSKQMSRLKEAGIRVYAVYGSHDYSPTRDSLIELLEADGVLSVVNSAVQDRSGVWLNGLHGLVGAKEVYRFGDPGLAAKFKPSVFMFHTGVYEANMTPREQSVPLSGLPPGYTYYAAGHLHKRIELRSMEGSPVNYPGPLFLGWGKADLENYFKGSDTGFYIVDVEGDLEAKFEYVPVRVIGGDVVEVCADGRSSADVVAETEARVLGLLGGLQPGSLVLIKVHGKLSGGRRVEVSVALEKLRRKHQEFEFELNDRQLVDPEGEVVESGEDFEERAMVKLASQFPVKTTPEFVYQLVQALGEEQPEGMTRADYQEMIRSKCVELLKSVFGAKTFEWDVS